MCSSCIQVIIDNSWDYHDPAQSEAKFREASGDVSNVADRLELQTQIARAQGLQQKFDEARCTLDEVARRLEAGDAKSNDPGWARAHVRLLLERGRVFNSSGQRDAALPLFEQAFHAAQRIDNDHLAIDAAHMMGIVRGAQGDASAAMAWNAGALEVATTSSQARARQWRATLHNNMGWALHASGDFAAALEHFEAALAIRRAQGEAPEIRIATWCVARCLRSLKRFNEALRWQQSIADAARGAGDEPDGFNEEELGECLLELGQAVQAAAHFRRAVELLSRDPWFVEREPQRLERMQRLSNMHDG